MTSKKSTLTSQGSHLDQDRINGYELVDLVLKHYNDLDEKYRELIPLKMVYIPVKPKEE